MQSRAGDYVIGRKKSFDQQFPFLTPFLDLLILLQSVYHRNNGCWVHVPKLVKLQRSIVGIFPFPSRQTISQCRSFIIRRTTYLNYRLKFWILPKIRQVVAREVKTETYKLIWWSDLHRSNNLNSLHQVRCSSKHCVLVAILTTYYAACMVKLFVRATLTGKQSDPRHHEHS